MTMREQMARAMYEGYRNRRLGAPRVWNGPWEDQEKHTHEFWGRFVDDALVAMMEPTERMCAAAQWAQFDSPNPPVQACVEANLRGAIIWKAMIRAARDGK